MQAENHLTVTGVDPDRTDRKQPVGESSTFEGALECARVLCQYHGLEGATIEGTLHGEPFAVRYHAEHWEEVA